MNNSSTYILNKIWAKQSSSVLNQLVANCDTVNNMLIEFSNDVTFGDVSGGATILNYINGIIENTAAAFNKNILYTNANGLGGPGIVEPIDISGNTYILFQIFNLYICNDIANTDPICRFQPNWSPIPLINFNYDYSDISPINLNFFNGDIISNMVNPSLLTSGDTIGQTSALFSQIKINAKAVIVALKTILDSTQTST
jgi:hypothetical protein